MAAEAVQIEENLFLGSLDDARSFQFLAQNKIKHVLSVIDTGMDEDAKMQGVNYTLFNVRDATSQNLVVFFEKTCEIIGESQKKNEGILIHCRMGQSRSATIVIAYLMKKYGKNLREVRKFVRKKKPDIDPNPSFVSQLIMWQEMGYRFDNSNMFYRMFMVDKLKQQFSSVIGSFSNDKRPKEIFDTYLNTIYQVPRKEKNYRCRNPQCRKRLFATQNILRNDRKLENQDSVKCRNIFIDGQDWMVDIKELTQQSKFGKLYCPKCRSDIGQFDWDQVKPDCQCDLHKPRYDFKESQLEFRWRLFMIKGDQVQKEEPSVKAVKTPSPPSKTSSSKPQLEKTSDESTKVFQIPESGQFPVESSPLDSTSNTVSQSCPIPKPTSPEPQTPPNNLNANAPTSQPNNNSANVGTVQDSSGINLTENAVTKNNLGDKSLSLSESIKAYVQDNVVQGNKNSENSSNDPKKEEKNK